MAYVTGTANSFSDLLTALRNACTANGWTLAGNVLHKGGCYADLQVGAQIGGGPAGSVITLRGGNGIDGSNVLTDASPGTVRFGRLKNGASWPDWDWPVTYHIHIHTSPDEVLMMINYSAGQRWQHCFFGKSPAAGNGGTGNWISCPVGDGDQIYPYTDYNKITIAADGGRTGGSSSGGFVQPAPFWWGIPAISTSADECSMGSMVHGCVDPVSGLAAWSSKSRCFLSGGETTLNIVSAAQAVAPLLGYSPNAWNNETVLIPIQVLQCRLSSKSSIAAELKHVRMCRNDFIDAGAVITIGPDKWKVYPCHRKDSVNRNGGGSIDHSGTIALAIRYDGP